MNVDIKKRMIELKEKKWTLEARSRATTAPIRKGLEKKIEELNKQIEVTKKLISSIRVIK